VIDVEPDRFEDMVVAALDGLPEELGRLMRNVAVTVEHDPGPVSADYSSTLFSWHVGTRGGCRPGGPVCGR
jgi:predicted Zn-dependent protease with MMP-like domain